MSEKNDFISVNSTDFQNKVNTFLDLYKDDPELYPEFAELTLRPHQLNGGANKTDDILTKKAEIYLSESYEFFLDIATITYDVDSGCSLKRGCWCKKRRVEGQCWAIFTHPSIQNIKNDIEECARLAATAAIIAAIWADPDAAVPAFKAIFIPCIKSKGIGWADEIGIRLERREHRGSYRPCETF